MVPINLSIRAAEDAVCPACNKKGLALFFEVRDVPVNCTAVFRTQEEALRVPRGDLSLGFCNACAYICNVSFDPSLLEKAGCYEDQQGFSPTFNNYSEKLADYLIDKYDLRGQTLVEIGCGKGDFIGLVCRRGNNRGVGIDPIGELRTRDENERQLLTLIPEHYSERHGAYKSRLIMCRHTLEHIQNPFELVSTVSRAIGENQGTAVFFEVPDVVRILNEKAFWDIYYEHCGYFSHGSIARLFRRCGFEVTNLERVYDGQYINLEAKKAVEGPSGTIRKGEETPTELYDRVVSFSDELGQAAERWVREIADATARGKKLAIWGSGSKCVSFLSTLHIESMIECVVDMNPNRQGMFMPGTGREIMAPGVLKKVRPDVVIVMNRIYEQEITEELRRMGLTPKVLAL